MDNITDKIKNRSVLTDYLEHIYLNKALDAFFKYKSKKFPFYVNIENLEKHYKTSEYFTRTWLSFMDDKEFGKTVKLMMNNNYQSKFNKFMEFQI